jgi:ureidoacrylate peracid hydrolase
MSGGARSLPLTLQDKLKPQGCALVVIDMQNDFCARGGYIDATMGKDVGAAEGVVDGVRRLVDAARAAAVPVLWLRADYSFERLPDSMLVKLQARGISAECCKPGTWGSDWFGVHPTGDEAIVTKHTYSGFAGTGLQQQLAGIGARTLVFAGVQTQVCVESTLRDAHSLGYFCVVPEDAVASHSPALHQATLNNIRFLFGDVCQTTDAIGAWSAARAS